MPMPQVASADPRGGEAEDLDSIRHEGGLQDEPRAVPDDGRQQHRPQQRMRPGETGALLEIADDMARRQLGPRLLGEAGQQDDGTSREHRGEDEGRCRSGPADERTGECRSCREGETTGQLEPAVRRRERAARHQRGDQSRCRDAEGDGSGRRDEADRGEQRQRQQTKPHQRRQREQGERPHGLGDRHQAAPRHAVGDDAGGEGEQQERQALRRGEHARLADPGAEDQHRDHRGRGEADLLGGLRREIRPGEAVELGRQRRRHHGRDLGRPETMMRSMAIGSSRRVPIVALELS
jgi:hypothetical protein